MNYQLSFRMLNDIQHLRFIIWTACTQIQNSLFSFNIAISSTPKETDGLTMIATRLVKIQRKKRRQKIKSQECY